MIGQVVQAVSDFVKGKPRARRHKDWSKLSKAFEKKNPYCAVCGRKGITPHHIRPVHLFPQDEMCEENLIGLCEAGGHHLTFGHFQSWKSYNQNVRDDAAAMREKIKARP